MNSYINSLPRPSPCLQKVGASPSKIAFVALVRQLAAWNFDFIDCQVETQHLSRFGAADRPRDEFLDALERALTAETRRGVWSFDHR